MVGVLGYSEERVWNSFFLQYLWEFCLGVKLAEWYVTHPSALEIPKWKYLIPACAAGMALTGLAGWAGFPWKLYNDIPSLIGYTSLSLIIYKLGVGWLNRFFSYTNRFSYEWYLVHFLVFWIVRYFTAAWHIPVILEMALCLALSYAMAFEYGKIWNRKKVNSKT